jgi:hypothetical protein
VATFRWKARTSDGRSVEGEMEAVSSDEAVQRLRAQGLTVTEIAARGHEPFVAGPMDHVVQYAGVLAPASRWRSRIAPAPPGEADEDRRDRRAEASGESRRIPTVG